MDQKIIYHCASIYPFIRQKNPLIHHITNMVVANDNANATLAVGASPVMASSPFEVEEITAQADALVLNLGILCPEVLESCLIAGKKANQKNIPIILDPVGAGSSQYRTQSAITILSKVKIAVIRGNAGEIAALLNEPFSMRGVDALPTRLSPSLLAYEVSRRYGVVGAVTGKIDYVSDGMKLFSIHNGHDLLTSLTGTGCMASSLCGTFAAIETNRLISSIAALGFLGVCAEIAGKQTRGPGSFHLALFDVMYNMDPKSLVSSLRIEEES